MRTVGQVLTITGLAQVVAGAIVIVDRQHKIAAQAATGLDGGCAECFPPYPKFIGPTLLATGIVKTVIGVPLWTVGAVHRKAPTSTRAAAFAPVDPRLSLGLGVASFEMAF
jgi:hypothetical protein